MLKVDIYVQGKKLDLFKDENIEINSSVQNIADISKTFSDFSQSFTVPCSDQNNAIFQHYYNTDVDGTFNPNIRVLGYIELGTLPYKYGLIQLEDYKIKDLKPSHYTIRFFSSTLNLSDLFKDDEFDVLDLSDYDHIYNSDVLDAVYSPTIAGGDVYYPLITSIKNYTFRDGGANDISTVTGQVKYTDLKPAIKLNAIINAIETHYGVTFKKEFFNRAVFDNLFMWMHRESGMLKAFGDELTVDITSAGSLGIAGGTVNTTANTVTYTQSNYNDRKKVTFKVIPAVGFRDVVYKVRIYDGTNVILESDGVGVQSFILNGQESGTYVTRYTVQATSDLDFTTQISIRKTYNIGGSISTLNGNTTTPTQTVIAKVFVSQLLPKMKIKDFITSIIKMFNLVLVPVNSTTFTLLPLDDWYAQGKLIDISDYIDTNDIVGKRPKLFKQIDFKHQNTGQILGEKFRENNGDIGYGDLKATYDIDGTDLKVETQFENLVFERLTDVSSGDLSNVQVGKSIDKTLQPYIGKPFIFYRCGYQFYDTPIKAQDHADITYSWLTSTENDMFSNQVTNCINFSTDISTFLYTENQRNLFSNYWEDYISDLYSLKRRITSYTAYLPIGVLIKLRLNDRLKIGDKAFIINAMKPNLTTGKVDLELLNYIGAPFTSVNDQILLTADTVDYFADTTLLTADMISLYVPFSSPIPNSVEYTSLFVSPSAQNYDCKINANQNYLVTKVDTGDGVSWVTLENANGTETNYLKIKVSQFTLAIKDDTQVRSMDLDVIIGSDSFTITITQAQQ